MRIKRIIYPLAVVFAAFGSLLFHGCAGGSDSAQVVSVAHGLPEDHPVHQALLEAQKFLDDQAAADVRLRIFPNNQLGSSVELAQMISQGNIDVGVISAASVARIVPELNLLSMPFLFRGLDHQREVLRGEVGEEVLGFLRNRNMFGLGYFTAGSRNIMTKGKAVRTPEDMAGLKIRVMESSVLVDTINAMGGSPVAMDMGEVYSALQQGLLDGWENNPPTAYFFRIHETGANQFSWTHHLMVPDVVVASAALEDRLSETQLENLIAAFDRAVEKQWEEWDAFTEKSVAEMKEAGVEFHELDTSVFQSRVDGIYERAFERYGENFRRLADEIRQPGGQ